MSSILEPEVLIQKLLEIFKNNFLTSVFAWNFFIKLFHVLCSNS